MQQALSRLTKVALRDIWISEAADFTPWLARPENLSVLADVLGIELQLEAQEQSVGPFRADILCKDIETNAWVLVENQLEATDHKHLGQLLTYASGLEAVTIVWIAARFIDEHRSTLDWLNKITNESFRFFGLEVELWRIGDSPAAPKFNIISKPNDWSRAVSHAARAIDDAQLSEAKLTQIAYWTALHRVLDSAKGPISGNRKPQPGNMQYHKTQISMLEAKTSKRKRRITVVLTLMGENAKNYFRRLNEQKAEIEGQMGYPLDWQLLPDGKESHIGSTLDNVDPEDRSDWPRQHEWMSARLNQMDRVFSTLLRDMDATGNGVTFARVEVGQN